MTQVAGKNGMPAVQLGPGCNNFPRCAYPEGSTYEGQVARPASESRWHDDYWEVDLPNGQGKVEQPDGVTLEGTFVGTSCTEWAAHRPRLHAWCLCTH